MLLARILVKTTVLLIALAYWEMSIWNTRKVEVFKVMMNIMQICFCIHTYNILVLILTGELESLKKTFSSDFENFPQILASIKPVVFT